jgi:glycosyltransferase involved in cell wall biosynthesis
MRIALVHDYLNQYGGAERVLEVLCSMFPDAPIYTTLYDEHATRGVFRDRDIRTSFLQRMPLVKRYHHAFPFLMPIAVEQFDFSSFDIVFSVSHSFAKGIITKPATRHISYCLTPPRYLWDDSHRYVQEFQYPTIIKMLAPPLLSYLRVWDREASVRPDALIAISDFVRQRIAKYYHRDANVLYPPVDVSKFHIADTPHEYYLMVGRLVTYKKFDIAIQAFNKLGKQLKIVGTGVDEKRLRRMAALNIEFLGAVDDQRLADLYTHAQAIIFPQEEDFGIVPLEAMASGRPVIAYRGGGAVETVVENETGIFFDEQTPESLIAALSRFDPTLFHPAVCRARAGTFDIPVFKEHILSVL